MKTIKQLFILSLTVLLFSTSSYGQSAEQKGLEIAKKADQQDQGFANSSVNLKMILKNRHGQETTRLMTTKTLEGAVDGDKSLITFNSPRDVKGTATLTYTHKTTADDQWLYLPAIKRVKRIASDNKSGPFMGSEFAYEDLSSQEIEKYSYKYVKDESINGAATHVVERDPVDPKSGYTKQVVWYNQKNFRIEKMEFYDRKGELLKTLNYSDYKLYLNKFWRASKFHMVNHQTGKETTLLFEDYQFKTTSISENDFNPKTLSRAR